MKFAVRWATIVALLALAAGATSAAPLRLQFSDPPNDYTGVVDVIGFRLDFSNTTGAYEILVSANPAHPFVGSFRINVNLFNPDTGTVADNPAFFQDTVNDFSYASGSLGVVLSGVNQRLTSWNLGDRVAYNTGPFGNPSGSSLFRMGVLSPLPAFSGEDSFGNFGRGDFAVIEAAPGFVPEPSTNVLAVIGLLALRYAAGRLRR